MKAIANYKPSKWDEIILEEPAAKTKMTSVSAIFDFEGELTAQAHVEYLMFYTHVDSNDPHKSVAHYVGLMRIKGNLKGKKGSFVMEDKGTYEAGVANSELTILYGSGTEELAGIKGRAKYHSTAKGSTCGIDYELEA